MSGRTPTIPEFVGAEMARRRSLDCLKFCHGIDLTAPLEAGQTLESVLGALRHISDLRASGPHISAEDGMRAAFDTLDRARDTARVALARFTPKDESNG